MEKIYEKYLQSMKHEDIEKFIISKKIKRWKINAKCNEDLRFGMTQMIKSSYPQYIFDNAIDSKIIPYIVNFDVYVRRLNSQYGVLIKTKHEYIHCSLCKKQQSTYEYRLPKKGRCIFYSCDKCILDIIDFTEKQVKIIGNKKFGYLLFLLKETDIYTHIDIDAFYYIFKLMLTY